MLGDTTLALYLIKLVDVLDQHNIDYRLYFTRSGLTAHDISSGNERISLAKYIDFVESVLAETDIPDIGFLVGLHTNILEHGLLGYSLLSSASLEKSLQRYIRFQHLVGPVLQVNFDVEGTRACLSATLKNDEWALSEKAIHYFTQEWLAGWVQWNELVRLKKDFLVEVEVGYSAHNDIDIYRQNLHCPITTNGNATRAWFSAELLPRPLEIADKQMGELCATQCELLLDAVQNKTRLVADLYWRLANSPGVIPSMEHMAEQFCITSRTLRRHLKSEKTTYQQVVMDFRMAMAKRYITESPFSANEIAELVGYSSSANFYRIFRREIGMTPVQYRKLQAARNEPRAA